MSFTRVSEEAEDVLMEILEHEHDSDYWKNRFDKLSDRDDIVLRGCFKELREGGLINAEYADNYPYLITILKDGYLYEKHLEEEKDAELTPFERELNELLKRARNIKAPINTAPPNMSMDEYNKPSEIWMNDVQIFYDNYLKDHALGDRIKTLLFHRGLGAYGELVAALTSVSKDRKFIDKINGAQEVLVPKYQAKAIPEYDVFISHANRDKEELVEDLYKSLGQFTRNYTQTVKRAADNKRRYAPDKGYSVCLLWGYPKGAAPHLAHDFAKQSVVCYTLCRRCRENAVAAGEGKGI